jgi:hypothetical protein
VEVTQDTLVYAGSQQEVLTGKIQVFAMHEMAWVKKEADNKFTVSLSVAVSNDAPGSSMRHQSGVCACRSKPAAESIPNLDIACTFPHRCASPSEP